MNILLAGYSADDTGHAGAELTDSIMILSMNPTNKSAVIISVPRDLYVNIPNYGYSKINVAYEYGGMTLLEQTITQDFGIGFNYYALINYTAFKDTVDAVSGVTVNINSSDARGLYDPNTNLRLANGKVSLTGQQALDLARARGDSYSAYGFPNGDFSRTADQQLLLLALKDKASSTKVIANPLKLGKLATAISNNVKTDMKISELETLYFKTKGMSNTKIKTVNLNNVDGTNYLSSYTTRSGQSALIPASGVDDYSNIQFYVQSLLS
ncbi:MAG: LCP family protein [Patescibacteria group bacterium]